MDATIAPVLELILTPSGDEDSRSRCQNNSKTHEDVPIPGDEYRKTESECNLFTFIVYVLVFGTMCLCGLLGNSLSFVVLLLDKYSHLPSTFLLRALALTDNFFLLTSGVSQIFSAVTLSYDIHDHPLTPYIRKYLWPLVHITQMETVWITVLISINRFIAICLPFRALNLCTMSRVRFQVGVLTVLIILYNIPRFYEYTIEQSINSTVTLSCESAIKKDNRYNIVYENLLYTLTVFLGPFLILTVLNVRLIREIIRLGNRLDSSIHHPVRDEEEERNITVVMIVVVILFLVSQTPACINHLLFYVIGSQAYLCGHPYFYYYHISNVVVSSNACFNFGIYCILRFRFRQRVYLLFRYGRSRAQSSKRSEGDRIFSRNGQTE